MRVAGLVPMKIADSRIVLYSFHIVKLSKIRYVKYSR